MLHVLILCHGNICRSPLGEVILEAAIARDRSLAGRVRVTSAGTSNEHEGEAMHPESAALLTRRGHRTTHRARRLTPQIAAQQDLILAADRWNLRDGHAVARAAASAAEVRLIRDYDPDAIGSDLDDPWSHPTSAYERVAREIDTAIPGILAALRERL
jgi:protein-tyrosine phosphatase